MSNKQKIDNSIRLRERRVKARQDLEKALLKGDKTLIEAYTEAIETVRSVMNSTKESGSARLKAADMIIEEAKILLDVMNEEVSSAEDTPKEIETDLAEKEKPKKVTPLISLVAQEANG